MKVADQDWRHEKHPAIGNNITKLETVKHCLNAVKRVWFFTDRILVTLNVNDDDDVSVHQKVYKDICLFTVYTVQLSVHPCCLQRKLKRRMLQYIMKQPLTLQYTD